MDFLLYRTRYIPESLTHPTIKNVLMSIEEAYRTGRIAKKKAIVYGAYIKKKYGIDFEILDDSHMIFLPHSDSILYRYFFEEPTTVAVIGGTGSGKTITAWVMALEGLNRLDKATVYVYNDVDGLGTLLSEQDSRIIVEQEAAVPPADGNPKIIIYNEMTEKHMWKRGMSSANVDLNLQALRRRHRRAWIIQNVITYSVMESVLKQTSTFKIFKWMDPVLLDHTRGGLPKGWKKLVETCAFLDKNEGLAIIPVKRRGNIYFIHETNPPQSLLSMHRRASKDKHLMMVESEVERDYLRIIGEIMAVDPKAKSPQVQIIMEKKHGIKLSRRRVRELISKWKEITKFNENER